MFFNKCKKYRKEKSKIFLNTSLSDYREVMTSYFLLSFSTSQKTYSTTKTKIKFQENVDINKSCIFIYTVLIYFPYTKKSRSHTLISRFIQKYISS